MKIIRPKFSTRSRARQSGMSLLAVSAMATVLSFAGFAAYRVAATQSQAAGSAGQNRLLIQADSIVEAFAAANSRLPCPAANRGEAQDCDSGRVKGYFPSDVAAAYAPGELAGDLQGLRYTVDQRLLRPTDIFPNSPNIARTVNGYDLCRELAVVQSGRGGADGGLPADEITGGMDVYGLAAAGVAGFTGANEDSAGHLESPGRERSADYTESVRMRKVRDLARNGSCATQINALNVLAMAHGWNTDLPADRDSEIERFTELTLLPHLNTILIWGAAAVQTFYGQVNERSTLITAIQAASAKDASICTSSAGIDAAACVAAGTQQAISGKALIQSGFALYELAVFTERIIQNSASLIQAEVRLNRYKSMDIWQGQDRVLETIDRRGAEILAGANP
ncbi:hypothetical protein DFR41_10814 [Pseudacidovorax intermedius]|uniref:Uncharacterized protein n=1 Tax=Pseudacidovorax intermedius TaxID=433924 RepID=A0A370F9S3_9BURK|nr:hypothetical protein [Pseudacidovorax intermedius]RDI21890.1 hypothetical protein DFR41_10814 [Pseudacidovorax intermedius]